MGLDSYLTGDKYFWGDYRHPERNRREDGFEVESVKLRLGYWRKHPDLHGFIVQSFADGVDNCEPIELDRNDLTRIIAAVQEKRLPKTSGFFFGASDNDQDEIKRDVAILERARAWLSEGDASPIAQTFPTAVGAGMTMQEVKLTKSAENDTAPRVTRSVIYRASW